MKDVEKEKGSEEEKVIQRSGNWIIQRIDTNPYVQVYRVLRNGDIGFYVLLDECASLLFLKPYLPDNVEGLEFMFPSPAPDKRP